MGVGFSLFGFFWGSWAVAAADLERALGVSPGGFGLLLSLALAGAAVGNAFGGALTERRGTARVLGVTLVVWAALIAVMAAARSRPALGAALVGVVTVGGMVDVAMNVAATAALAATPGRLVRFHGRFNLGAAGGAALTGTLIGTHHGWRWPWVGVAVVAALLGLVCLRAPLPAGEAGERSGLRATVATLRRERLVLVEVAFAVGAMVEGGIELWGVLYMRTRLASGLLVGAGGAVAAYLLAASARLALGPRVGRSGPVRGVAVGAGTAAAGTTLMAVAPTAWVAALGLVAAAGGVSMCWPLLLAHASAGRPRPGLVVGAVSGVGYLGLVLGPTLVGVVAEGVGLRAGLGLLAAAAVFVAIVPALAGPSDVDRAVAAPSGPTPSTSRRSQPRSERPSAPVTSTATGAVTRPRASWTRGGSR